MIEKIKEWDTELFLFLNQLHIPMMDIAMYWITDRWFWFPFYGLIIFLLIKKFRMQGVWMVLTIIVAVALADQAASSFFKPYFSRYRPCHEVELQPIVHVVRGCGGQYGFVSSHAATTFSFAMIMWLLVRQTFRHIYFLFAWAAIVSYSRIYVGVHYPLDLVFGSMVGMSCALIGYLLYKYFERWQANKNPQSPVT